MVALESTLDPARRRQSGRPPSPALSFTQRLLFADAVGLALGLDEITVSLAPKLLNGLFPLFVDRRDRRRRLVVLALCTSSS